jgi:hypothetical protein
MNFEGVQSFIKQFFTIEPIKTQILTQIGTQLTIHQMQTAYALLLKKPAKTGLCRKKKKRF